MPEGVSPEPSRSFLSMSKRHLRLLSVAALFAASALLVYLGFQGWVFYEILPLQNLGYLLAVAGILGLLGVNIWYGGPLDPRRDQVVPPTSPPPRADPLIEKRWREVTDAIQDWGTGWAVVPPGSGLQHELDTELTASHPLGELSPVVFARCASCDDVAASVLKDPPIAIIHLTWRGRPEKEGWPSYLLLTVDEFVDRFLRLGEHS